MDGIWFYFEVSLRLAVKLNFKCLSKFYLKGKFLEIPIQKILSTAVALKTILE
jgi:hypothetical protein